MLLMYLESDNLFVRMNWKVPRYNHKKSNQADSRQPLQLAVDITHNIPLIAVAHIIQRHLIYY